MRFRVKDLIIDVLQPNVQRPGDIVVPFPGCVCTDCSYCSQCSCTVCSFCSQCSCTVACTAFSLGGGGAGGFVAEIPSLPALRDRLKLAIAQVEALERVLEEHSQPETDKQSDDLEDKLSGALEALQRRKEELRKRGQGNADKEP